MSQHDYNISNADGATFRTDLNAVLAAIRSANSGATAPSTTFAHMFWYDTTNNILYQRNEADDAWIARFFDTGATGKPAPMKNALMNSDANIWQRGTSFATIATSAFFADRFSYKKNGAMVHTASRSTDVPTVAQSGHLSNYSILVDCTTIDASIAAGDFCFIEQRVEGFNFLPLAQKTMTLSFWHKHTLAGTYCVALRNSTATPDRSYVAEYTQAVSDTWEKAIIVVTASPSAGTWDYLTGIGIQVSWALASGATTQGTVNIWNSANVLSTVNQVNACNNVANNFRIAQWQLEAGNNASDLEYRDMALEEYIVRRYYEELNIDALASYFFGVGACTVTTAAWAEINYLQKRVAPTITISDFADFIVTQANGTSENVTALSHVNISTVSARAQITVAANLVAGNATLFHDDSGGNARIKISAEL